MLILADFLSCKYTKLQCATSDQKEIYKYGIQLIIDDIINFSLVLAISAIFHSLFCGIAFLVTLCITRRFSGGFHANTRMVCRMTMILTLLFVLLIVNNVTMNSVVILIFDSLTFVTVAVFAPISHINKPLTSRLMKKNKVKSILAVSSFSAVSAILNYNGRIEGAVISLSLLAVSILLLIGLIIHKAALRKEVFYDKQVVELSD